MSAGPYQIYWPITSVTLLEVNVVGPFLNEVAFNVFDN